MGQDRDTLQTERLARIDAAIAGHRNLYLSAVFVGHDGEAEHHEWQVDRLLDLRTRVQRKAAFHATGIGDAQPCEPSTSSST